MKISSFVLRPSYFLLPAFLLATTQAALPQARPLDTARSSIAIRVGRTGVFSFAGDNHLVRAPLASGSVNEAGKSIAFKVQSKSLRVEDPGTAADKKAQIQQRMLGPDVLDSEHFPTIEFRSTSIAGEAAELRVTGDLTLRGQTRPVEAKVQQIAKGHWRGTAVFKQSAFGIKPISIAGGTVKVKDELKIEFEIFAK
jgi:polyisoprenoid-binding protein YceI